MPPKPTPDRKSGAWSPEERERLRWIVKTKWLSRPEIQLQAQREGVNINAAIGVQWSQVAQEHGTRNSKQCRERWDNHERDDLDRDPIKRSTELGKFIEKYMRERGHKWAEIGRLVNRPENQVKNFGFQVIKALAKEKSAKETEMAEAAHREAAQHSRNTSVSSLPSLASDHGSPLDPKSPYTTDALYMSSHLMLSPRHYPYHLPYEGKGHPMDLPPMMPSIRPLSSDGPHINSALTTPTLDRSRPCSGTSSPASLFTPGASPTQRLLRTPAVFPTALFRPVEGHPDKMSADPLWSLVEATLDNVQGPTEQRLLAKKARRASHQQEMERKYRRTAGHNESDLGQLRWIDDRREEYADYFETVNRV